MPSLQGIGVRVREDGVVTVEVAVDDVHPSTIPGKSEVEFSIEMLLSLATAGIEAHAARMTPEEKSSIRYLARRLRQVVGDLGQSLVGAVAEAIPKSVSFEVDKSLEDGEGTITLTHRLGTKITVTQFFDASGEQLPLGARAVAVYSENSVVIHDLDPRVRRVVVIG